MGWNRRRSYALVGFAAVAGLLLAVVPAFGDSQPDAVRLHLGTDGQYFEYEGTFQHLDLTSTRCEIKALDGPVMALDANRKVGLNSFGIGVKSGGAQGTPCGRVEAGETLTLSVPESEDGVLHGRFFDGVQLDLELKGNAVVVATLNNGTESRVFKLASGSSIPEGEEVEQDGDGVFEALSTESDPDVACGAQSDSGPDAGSRDNCLWTIEPNFEFNEIVLSADVGEFSLEGSADYGDDPAFDSLFFIANAAPVAVDDEYTTRQNTTLTVAAPGVLGNDTDDDDGDAASLKAELVGAGVSNGTLSLNANGSFTYAPDTDFTGSDSFTYKANDGEDDSNTATVSIEVTPTLECGDETTFPRESGEPTYTVLAENGDDGSCTKDIIEYDAGDLEGEVVGETAPAVKLVTAGDQIVVFLERLVLEDQVFTGDSQIPSLYYDDDLSDGIQETLAPFCLVDPRVVNTSGALELHDDYNSAAEADKVLPTDADGNLHTTCIISAEFVTVGDVEGEPLVRPIYWFFNLNDGFRTFK